MALRHILFRFTPRLDGRWLIGLLVIGLLVLAGTFVRWGGAAPPLALLALGPQGEFQDTLRVPASWGDTATTTTDAVARVPLILGVRNLGQEPVRPERLSLSLPLRYRLTGEAGQELDGRMEEGSPLITYTLEPRLGAIEPERMPTMLPAHDTLWLEVIIPRYYCVAVADSIPEFVPAPPPPLEAMSDVRLFYAFEGGDLRERRTGTLTLRLDTTLLEIELPADPPTFEMTSDPVLAQPQLGTLRRVGSRQTRCGEPESPMEILSTVWETEAGGRFITLDYGGVVRKQLYDLDGDGVIERESWAPAGDGAFTATRRTALPIPEFLLPVAQAGPYDMARFDTIPADSVLRLDPFRGAMQGPGDVPGGALGPGADSARQARRAAEDRGIPAAAPPGAADTAVAAPPRDSLPEPRIEPAGPLGRPVEDTIPGGGGRSQERMLPR